MSLYTMRSLVAGRMPWVILRRSCLRTSSSEQMRKIAGSTMSGNRTTYVRAHNRCQQPRQYTTLAEATGLPTVYCHGCGVVLQSEAPHELGFIPEDKLHLVQVIEAEQGRSHGIVGAYKGSTTRAVETTLPAYDDGSSAILELISNELVDPTETQKDTGRQKLASLPTSSPTCSRCHDLTYHRGRKTHAPLEHRLHPSVDISDAGLVVCVVDIIDFSGSISNALCSKLQSAKAIILVVNKIDLLPCDALKSELKIIRWIEAQPEYKQLPNVLKIHLVSAETGWGIPRLLRRIHDYCRGKDESAIIVGQTNVGKSSLINRMLGSAIDKKQNQTHAPVTISAMPGTTLGPVRFELVRGSPTVPDGKGNNGKKRSRSIFFRRRQSHVARTASSKQLPTVPINDTAGIHNPEHLSSYLLASEQYQVLPTGVIKPEVYTLKPGSCLLFGSLAKFSYLDGPLHVIATVFSSKPMKPHQTKIDRCKDLMENSSILNLAGLFERGEEIPLPPLACTTKHKLIGKGWTRSKSAGDIVLPGIGWISVSTAPGTEVEFETKLIEGTIPSKSRAPLPFYYK